MLLDFSVGNFRSIRDEQRLSLLPAGKDESLCDSNVLTTRSELAPATLRGAVIYGANASGKSNLVGAMLFFQAMVRDSATKLQAGQRLNVAGFAFDEKAASAPSSFELNALVDGIRYQYGFSLSPERVTEEWLIVYRTSRGQEWFSRTWNAEKATYDYAPFSAYFAGSKDLWKRSTRDNALFLSTAVQLNSEQLRPLWDWIVGSWIIIAAQAPLSMGLTIQALGGEKDKLRVLEFLNAADIAIADVRVQKQRMKQTSIVIDAATGAASASNDEADVAIPIFRHSAEGRSVEFGLQDESQGTQRLFALAGYVLGVLKGGMTLVVDEIESSMHPLLVRHLLKLFFSPDAKGAQIVFSTHSTNLLDNELLRRDQVWFTEKGADQATVLTPLSDFSPRKTEAFEKGYLEGRYGAIPILREYAAAEGANARE